MARQDTLNHLIPVVADPARRPSDRALLAFWRSCPAGEYECGCGKVGPHYWVQPQHPFYAEGRQGVARCTECHNTAVAARRARRKVALDAMPRCEAAGCRRRATYRVGAAHVGLCGRHLRNVRAQRDAHMAAMPFLGLFGAEPPLGRAAILALAEGRAAP